MNKEKNEDDNLLACDPSLHAQSYIGTKQVKAFPMCLEDAARYLNRRIEPAKQLYSGEGYVVIYEDDYISWSPKEVFDKSYKKCETYMDRLLIEREDLEVKVLKLAQFVNDGERERLAKRAEHHLDLQLKAMNEYLSILNERINPNEGCEGNTCCGGDKCQEGA